ncbi:MAG TPA: hypothetical protein VL096_08240, partial [Pirellulaceae bacterium]|nr:hypothetical protein [Pirellulaceae bacterium]
AAWGFRELSFNQLGGNERPDFFAVNHLLPAQFQRFADELPELRARMAARGLVICGSEAYLERIAATTARQPIPIDDCLPGTEFLFIDAMERVSPCSFTIDEYGVPLETVSSPEKFLALPSVFHELRRRSRANACADCHATHVFAKFKRQDACSDATVM